MFSIWFKLLRGEKIIRNALYEFGEAYNKDNFFEYLSHICAEEDIPVPVILTKHIGHFTEYNNTRFDKSDFVDEVKFDTMVIEFWGKDKKDKNKRPRNPLTEA